MFRTKKSARLLSERIESLARENQRLFEELNNAQKRFDYLAHRTWQVQEDERCRLSRDLHDHLGQNLTALIHLLERIPGDDTQRDCVELARNILQDTRELSHMLRPQLLDNLGIGIALQWLGKRIADSAGIEVSVSADELPHRPDPDIESLLFRIAQESLNNVTKHSQAHHVSVLLLRSGNFLELRIRDDGIGFDPDAVTSNFEQGLGLKSMKERVRIFGGKIAIASSPGCGAAITVAIRMQADEDQSTTLT